MSAPGWYPDPQGGPQTRFWDGSQWTSQTRPAGGGQPQPGAGQPQYGPAQPTYGQQQYGGGQPPSGAAHPPYGAGQPPYGAGQPPHGGGPQVGGTPPAKPNHLALWIALGVSIALIIGVGTWLLLRPKHDHQTTPQPTPTTSAPASPTASDTPEASTPAETTPAETTPAETTPAETTPAESTPGTTPSLEPTTIQVGDVIKPATCTGHASDAIGKVGSDNRVTSGAGLSFPTITGWEPAPVQYPWIYQSNSQRVIAGPNWMAALTVGTLNADDGFTDIEQSALRVVECMLGSDFYGAQAKQTKVTYVELQSADENYWLDAEVEVTGVEGITADSVLVGVAKRGSVLHVVVGTAPVDTKSAHDALLAAFDDLKIA